MVLAPKPRTWPTVRTNQGMTEISDSNKSWELRIGIVQTVLLLGLITGSMVVAYGFGFISGQKAGFESALASNINSTVRIPITSDTKTELASNDNDTDNLAPDAESAPPGSLAKLGGDLPNAATENADSTEALPELSEMKTTAAEALPEQAPASNALPADNDLLNREKTFAKAAEVHPTAHDVAKVGAAQKGSQSEASGNGKTLADLFPKKNEVVVAKENHIAKVEEKPLAKVVEPVLAETEAAPPKTENRSLIKDILPRGWFAQVAAPHVQKDAEKLAGRLKSSGFSVSIERAQVKGEEYFRVMVGPEDNRGQAETLVKQLRRESYLTSEPFLRQVK